MMNFIGCISVNEKPLNKVTNKCRAKHNKKQLYEPKLMIEKFEQCFQLD